jgi:Asp-tRNA(Asn)/Glu-tRNA(Gln) amidotransferase A subunit family amidase
MSADSLIAAVDAIAEGRLTASALAEAQLARVVATDHTIEAWETLDPAHVRRETERADAQHASGLLAGVGIGVKDLIATADLPTTMGSPIFAGHRPSADATLVTRLRAAGGYVFGKTVTTAFAYMDPGKTRNPWHPAHTPGGSSSGSAAAVAAGHVLAAIGTQTNGSVLRPATYCGVVGFKPTLDAIPTEGVYPFSVHLDTVGTFTQTVADAACLASVLADAGRIAATITPLARAPRLRYLRAFPWTTHDSDAIAALDAVVAKLSPECDIDQVLLPDEWRELNVVHRTIMLFEGAQTFADLQQRERGRLSAQLNAAFDEGRAISVERYRDALGARARAIEFFTDWLQDCDAVLAPTAPGPAPRGLTTTGDPSCCTLFTLLGFPAISIPVAMLGALPLGMQLAAPQNGDDRLLSVAAWCEARLPFARWHPARENVAS